MPITQEDWNELFNFWQRESLRVQRLVKSSQQGKIGWKVIHQRKIKDYIPQWVNYFKFVDENPRASDSRIQAATGIHWRGTIYMRYLGMITENKKITPPAVRFYKNQDMRAGILQQQVEKWHYCVDDFFRPGDATYNIFPFFVLLKILIEIGKKSGHCSITLDEFRYFVLITKKYYDYKMATEFILAYRTNSVHLRPDLERIFSNTSYDRVLFLLEISNILKITRDAISIENTQIQNAKNKTTAYEMLELKNKVPYYHINKSRYFRMLYSDETIFEFCESEQDIDQVVNDVIAIEEKSKITDEDETKIEKKIEKARSKLTASQLKDRIKKILQRRSIILPNSLRKKYRKQSNINEKDATKIERTIGRLLADYFQCCQIKGCGFSFPKGKGGKKGNYVEAHHLQSLADNGKDVPENIVVLCANHHRQFHYDNAKLINRAPKEIVAELSGKQHKINIDYSP
ncbi:MAG: HNH endonuclease [Candidatus Omnitrophica bacterium]|nr:HNH endonuclease [Candidatus Omnitrophota bacterium]